MNNFRFPAILFIIGCVVVVFGAFLKIIGNGGLLSRSLLIAGMTATAVSVVMFFYNLIRKHQ